MTVNSGKEFRIEGGKCFLRSIIIPWRSKVRVVLCLLVRRELETALTPSCFVRLMMRKVHAHTRNKRNHTKTFISCLRMPSILSSARHTGFSRWGWLCAHVLATHSSQRRSFRCFALPLRKYHSLFRAAYECIDRADVVRLAIRVERRLRMPFLRKNFLSRAPVFAVPEGAWTFTYAIFFVEGQL